MTSIPLATPYIITGPPSSSEGNPEIPIVLGGTEYQSSKPTAASKSYSNHDRYYKEANRRVTRWEDDYDSKKFLVVWNAL